MSARQEPDLGGLLAPIVGERPAAPGPQLARRALPGLDLLRPIAAAATAPATEALAGTAGALAGQAEGALAGVVESATTALGGGQQAAEPDIEAIAQKVYEHLRRRLRIDQERLGRY